MYIYLKFKWASQIHIDLEARIKCPYFFPYSRQLYTLKLASGWAVTVKYGEPSEQAPGMLTRWVSR